MTSYKRGDVVLVHFPNSDLVTYKDRPALIVQSNRVKTDINQRVIVMITSNLGRSGITRIPVQKLSIAGQQMGLQNDSVVVTDNMITVLDKLLGKVIGRCPLMPQIDTALREVLDL